MSTQGDILTCHNCLYLFIIEDKEDKRTKYCGDKCMRHAQMKIWRMRNKPIFPPKNCEQCGDEFAPTRQWQRFCHRDCLILWQNNYGRKRHTCKKHPRYHAIHKPRSTSKHPGGCTTCWKMYNRKVTPVLETFPGCKEFNTHVRCDGKDCRNKCHVIKREYPDGTRKIVSHQQGWKLIEDIFLCVMCANRFNKVNEAVSV